MFHYSHLAAQRVLNVRGHPWRSVHLFDQPTGLRQGSTRAPYPFREPPVRPCWRFPAAFPATWKQNHDALYVLFPQPSSWYVGHDKGPVRTRCVESTDRKRRTLDTGRLSVPTSRSNPDRRRRTVRLQVVCHPGKKAATQIRHAFTRFFGHPEFRGYSWSDAYRYSRGRRA